MGKLYWRMIQDPNSPWAIICNQSLKNKSRNSTVYKCLARGKLVFDLRAKHIIHSGMQTSFWTDCWLPQGPLRDSIAGPLLPHETNLKVAHVLDDTGNSKWDSLSFKFPHHIVQAMISLPRNPLGNGMDTLSWGPNSNGEFTLKSAYSLLCHQKSTYSPNLKCIWKLGCHPRHQLFCWTQWHQALPTSFLLSSRGIINHQLCVLCGSLTETAEHLFKSCTVSCVVWNFLPRPPSVFLFSSHSFVYWFKNCAKCQDTSLHNIPFGTIFIYCIWSLWLARNEKAFTLLLSSLVLSLKRL